MKGEKKLSEVSQIENQARLYIGRSGVYNREPGQRDLFYESAARTKIRFWRKKATWVTKLRMADYKTIEDTACQQLKWTTVMTNIWPVSQEEALYPSGRA